MKIKIITVLIPFMSGLVYYPRLGSGLPSPSVLIPFMSGLVYYQNIMGKIPVPQGLNPLYVGSRLLPKLAKKRHDRFVS